MDDPPRYFVCLNVQAIENDILMTNLLHQKDSLFETDDLSLDYVGIYSSRDRLLRRLERGCYCKGLGKRSASWRQFLLILLKETVNQETEGQEVPITNRCPILMSHDGASILYIYAESGYHAGYNCCYCPESWLDIASRVGTMLKILPCKSCCALSQTYRCKSVDRCNV